MAAQAQGTQPSADTHSGAKLIAYAVSTKGAWIMNLISTNGEIDDCGNNREVNDSDEMGIKRELKRELKTLKRDEN